MVDGSKSVVTQKLRPFQQTSAWTFSSALALLKSSPEDAASDALDEFLTHNKHVILSPVALQSDTNGTQDKPKDDFSKKAEFTLRGVLFSGVTDEVVRNAKTLASVLSIENIEAVRIILQTDQRSPEPAAGENSMSRLLFGGPGNGQTSELGRARLLLYAKAALKERRSVLSIAAECFNLRNLEASSVAVRNLGKKLVVSPDYVLSAVSGLDSLISLVSGQNSARNGDLEKLICDEALCHVTRLLQVVFEILVAAPEIHPDFASAWFKLMQKTSFVLNLAPYFASKDTFAVVHGLITIISLQIFDLPGTNSGHLNDAKLFAEISALICENSPNNILSYAWLITLHRKSILLEEFSATNENFLSVVPLKSTQTDMSRIQNNLHNAPVFREIVQLSRILSFDNIFGIVLTDLVLAAIPLVHPTDDIIACISEVVGSAPNPSIEKFFNNEAACQLIVLSRAKFPVSLKAYLDLASINGSFALHEFEELSSYMSVMEKAEFGTAYEVDSENTDLVRLTKSLNVFPPFEPAMKLSLLIEKDTKAQIFTTAEDNKSLVTFLHKYKGWAFLGRVIENISKYTDSCQGEKCAVLESILNVLIKTTSEDPAQVSFVLKYMSSYTDESDIVDVFFRLFEQSLHNRNIVLSEKIVNLLSNLMPIVSARIWPYLSTSSLLSRKGKEGLVSILFGSIEAVQGEYKFTSAIVKFVFCLTDNCLSVSKDYPEDAKSEILAKFVEHIIQVFENYAHLKFNDSFHKLELGNLILGTFRRTLDMVYSIGPGAIIEQKPTKVFALASHKILDAFLSPAHGPARSYGPILDLIDSLASPSISFDAHDVSGFSGDVWVHSAFSFAKLLVLIRISTLPHPSAFEEALFARLPQLVTIYSAGGPLRNSILDLLTALPSGGWKQEKMPSILSHLGQDHSRILLESLATDLETSFDDYSIKISIYDFLCSIMEANQQGLSVLFISGRNVFGEMANKSVKVAETGAPDQAKTRSLLSIMKRNVQDVKFYPPAVTVHLLDAISLAFNSWTTARSDDSDVSFVKELVSILGTFTKLSSTKTADEKILASYDCKVHAKIAEILSLVLFTTKNEKCVQEIQGLITSSSFIERLPSVFTVQDYDSSLYDNVKSHFANVFEDFQLSDFAVAIKKRNRFGPSMVYDLFLLDSFLEQNPKWPEVRDQIIYLSANMQHYHSQVSLSKSAGALLTTFCRRSPLSVPKEFAKLIPNLLTIEDPNDRYAKSSSSQQSYERIELAFLLLFTVNNTKDGRSALIPYSIPIIDACNQLMQNPDVGYLSVNKNDFTYRSLLRIAYIALSNLKTEFEVVNTRTQALSKLFDFVVAQGTTSIIIELQNDVYLARTNKSHKSAHLGERLDDLRLILSVLKVFVQLEVTGSLQAEFTASLQRHNTVNTILGLYSFSHLILVNNEPIFAQLGLMFIQQLLMVDEFADRIVDSKLFTVIRESLISHPLRNGGIFVSKSQQLHGTWTNGILPIMVSCLSRGRAVNECVFTLSAFAKQIESTIASWSNDSSALQVSTAGTFETMQILYIFQFLMTIAVSQGLQAKDAADVDMPVLPGLDTQQKRDDFVGFVGNLLKHPTFLKSRVYPSSADEEALMKAEGKEYDVFVQGLLEDIKELKEFF